jgi:hypothetical protein
METKFGKIIRHDEAVQDKSAVRMPAAEEVKRHIEKHFGEPSLVIHEKVSHHVHVDVIPPGAGRDFHTLLTSGMSDKSMNAPEGAEGMNYAELVLCLPASWQMKPHDVLSRETDWPVLWLNQLARFPHAYNTWLFWGHSVPNGHPPQPLAPETSLCAWVLLEPKLVEDEFKIMKRSDGGKTWFLAAVPTYREELDLKLSSGAETLEELFAAAGISELIDPNRRNVALRQ